MAKVKHTIVFLIFFAVLAFTITSSRASGRGISDIILEQLKQRQKTYISQREKLNKDILSLQKTLACQEKNLKNKKYPESRYQEELKQKEGLEGRLTSLIISLADAEHKIDAAATQIEDLRRPQTSKSPPAKDIPDNQNEVQVQREQETEPARVEYKIAEHDELQINVYGEPDLTKTVRVAVDGNISYPLLGRVKVAGLTTQELEDSLSKLLREGGYIVNPQVSVYMEKFSTISILGEVRNPGSYELKGKFGILDAVAQAGGFNIDADINNVKILRVQDGQQTTTQLRLGDIKKGLETTEIVLKPNDTICVEKIGKVTVLGEVSRPGTFELKDRLTVLEAIAMAGGFTDVASINSTRIIRAEEGSKKVIRIKVTDITRRGQREKDIELFPGDIIYVPESLF
jgi:polysaccharide export outer membrane protein